MADVRGNVDTRLAKVERGEYDAVVLAKAGLDRLGMSGAISEVLSAEVCLPAAGQGAIGIEMRAAASNLDQEIAITVGQLNHAPTRLAVEAERAVLAGLVGRVRSAVWECGRARKRESWCWMRACCRWTARKPCARDARVRRAMRRGSLAK